MAALLSLFGTLLFQVTIAPRVLGRSPAETAASVRRRLLGLTRFSVAACLLGLLGWLAMQSADMADAGSVLAAVRAIPTVLAQTDYGRLVALQILVLLMVAVAVGWRDGAGRQRVALGLAALALALQAGHSHAASMYSGPSVLLVTGVVHLLGAGAWLGGLVPLLLVVQTAPAAAGALAARWFSPLGKLCLVALTASALFQGWVLVAGIPGLVGTAYGWMVLVKLGLFGVLFAFAVVNRYRLAPALLRDDPAAAKRALVRSIAVQTVFGLAIVAAASVLSSLPPAMHEQPVWPFPQMFTLDTVEEDPEFRNEVLGAVLALAGAALLLVIGGRHPPPGALGCGAGCGGDRLVRRAASGLAVRAGPPDELLPLADQLRRGDHRAGGGVVPNPLRDMPRHGRARGRPGGQGPAPAARRPDRRAPLDARRR